MPRTTKAETQGDLLHIAEMFMAASMALEDDPIDAKLLGLEESEAADLLEDDTGEVFELTALNWLEIVRYMTGDGSRGTYDQIPKSADFFSVCLRAPDREFRHMFR